MPGQYSCDCPTTEDGQDLLTGTNCESRVNADLCSDASCSDCVVDYRGDSKPFCICEAGTTRGRLLLHIKFDALTHFVCFNL